MEFHVIQIYILSLNHEFVCSNVNAASNNKVHIVFVLGDF